MEPAGLAAAGGRAAAAAGLPSPSLWNLPPVRLKRPVTVQARARAYPPRQPRQAGPASSPVRGIRAESLRLVRPAVDSDSWSDDDCH